MKRVLIFLLIAMLLLSGCAGKQMVTFYYCHADYMHSNTQSIIAGESRDISSHSHDLNFLIPLYLMGPSEKDLVSAFPQDVKLLSVRMQEDALYIELSQIPNFSEAEYALACACMAMTFMELTDAGSVSITSPGRSITISQDNLTLFDTGIPTEPATGG